MKRLSPSVEEYSSWLDFVLQRQHVATMKAVMALKSQAALKNALGNSHVQIGTFEIANSGLDAAIDTAFGQFRRISRIIVGDAKPFKDATEARLRSFVTTLQDALTPGAGAMPGSGELLKKKLPELTPYLDRALRWYDKGLLEVTEPLVPISMTNTIHVGGNVIGSPIQQGVEASTQSNHIAIGDIHSSIEQLENALRSVTLAEVERASLAADIKTIKAQLEKPSPSRAILVEAARSIRSVVENIVATAITPQTLGACSALMRALGLS